MCIRDRAWYLKKHTGSQKFGACYFGVFYALSGYMAAYSWNIMWLDCIVLLPLILHGLERLVREKKGLFYCLMLGLSILSLSLIHILHRETSSESYEQAEPLKRLPPQQ